MNSWPKVLFLVLFLISGCAGTLTNEIDRIGSNQWNPELAAPVLNSNFEMADYLDAVSNEVTVSFDSAGVVVLEYRGPDVVSQTASDLIVIPDQTYQATLDLTPVELTNFNVSGSISKSFHFDFNVDTGKSDALDSMTFKQGDLLLSITGAFPTSGSLVFDLPYLQINGIPYSKTFSWTYSSGSSSPQQFQLNLDLTNAFIDYTKNGATTSNFSFDIDLTLSAEGTPVSLGDKISVTVNSTNQLFGSVFGHFASRTLSTNRETVSIGVLHSVEANSFTLDQPEVNILFRNSFGLNATIGLTNLQARNSAGNTLPFTGSIVSTPISINRPAGFGVGQFAETNLQINQTNSNLSELISFLPSSLDYQFLGSLQSSTQQQFVVDTSRITGTYMVRLPMSGTASTFTSTKDFDFNGSDFDVLKEGLITIRTTNGLPIEVLLDVLFIDSGGNILESLLTDPVVLSSGTVDSNGYVSKPSSRELVVPLNQAFTDNLAKSTKIRVVSTISTVGNGSKVVKIRKNDQVNISVFLQSTLGN